VLGVVALAFSARAGWPPETSTALAQGSAPASTPAPTSAPAEDMAVGVIVDTTSPRSIQLAREAGFTHVKMIVHWPRLEPRRGRYTFAETSENDLDNVMKVARAEDVKLVVRVDGVPDWAGGTPSKVDAGAVEAFYAAMAAHGRGTVVGYEILNEPNLPFEWGGPPSPSGYTAFLKAAYRGIKQGDPSALVIGGGPSPNTGGFGGTIEDVDFLRGMYAAGANESMDALGVHNYGGNHAPERDPGDCGICFRRAEIYRQVMVEQGDGGTPVWSTEFGWLLDPGRDMGQYDWMRVSAEQQAEYIVRAYRYARQNWPWMQGMLLSNLDASTSPYHQEPRDGLPWFAILNKDHSPRPAWRAVKAWREQDRATGTTRSRGSASAHVVASPAPQLPSAPATAPGGAVLPARPASLDLGAEAGGGPPSTSAPDPIVAVAGEPPTDPPTPASAVPPVPPSAPTTPARLRVAKTDGAGVNMRADPDSDARAVAILLEGTTVEVVGEDVQAEGLTWRQVRTIGSTADGVTGWVAAQYLLP
jgi:hypothetical protein